MEIAKAIAKEMGKELEIKDMAFDAALMAVQNGTADFAAAGISITPERLEKMDFTIEYATSKQVVVVKKRRYFGYQRGRPENKGNGRPAGHNRTARL